MTTILLIPVRLLAKALLYLLAAVVGSIGFVLLFISTILQRIGFMCGGMAILVAGIMWLLGEKTAWGIALSGAAAILVPVVIMFISDGFTIIKEKLLDVSADIELVS